jgi:hypothetical protein
LFGSADDIRGDDVNLHWFNTSNNPFILPAGAIDGTTYFRGLANLPGADAYAENGDRSVAAVQGFANTEAVMQQGQLFDEAQRDLTADGVATIRLAESGIDEIENTVDDYSINLIYHGEFSDPLNEPGCDIAITMDDVASFAFCSVGGAFIGSNHIRITTAFISINSNFNWFYNQISNDPDTDSDGIADSIDNCIEIPNGTLIPDAGGNSQRDTDSDGFGNICDPDFNQNNIVDPVDFSQLKSALGSVSANEDLNGNGVVDPSDFSRLKALLGQAPGPSGLVP